MSDSASVTAPAGARALLDPPADFVRRHVGPGEAEIAEMLKALGVASLDALVSETVPAGIRLARPLALPLPLSEEQALEELGQKAAKNRVLRSFIGMGYHDCHTPPVILRNVLENPGWYTQYTPYQAEIAQGRLEALLNFQTMVADLTGLPLANASLLDEATAAGEAMTLCRAVAKPRPGRLLRRRGLPPADDRGRAHDAREPLGIEVDVGPVETIDFAGQKLFGVLVQYPATDGVVRDFARLRRARARGGRAARRGDRPPRPHPAHAAGRARRGRRGRLGPALRRADGLRRPARRLLRDEGRAQAAPAGPARRRLEGRRGPAGLPPGAADPRAAHPPREGDEQHLHRAGAARRSWPRCTRSTTARRACGEIARRVHALARVLQRACGGWASTPGTRPSSTRCASRTAPGRAGAIVERARAKGINLRAYDDGVGRASRSTRPTLPGDARRPARGLRGRAGRLHAGAAGRRGRARGPRAPRARTTRS